MGKIKGQRPLRLGWLIILCCVACAAAGSGAYYVVTKKAKSDAKPVESHRSIVVVEPGTDTDNTPDQQQDQQQTQTQGRKIVIFLPKYSEKGYYLVPVTRTTDEKGDILDLAIRTLLATNKQDGDEEYLIPHDTRLLSPVKVKNVTATVNLSKEFVDNFSGGSDQEALTLNSIAHTIVSNSDGKVEKVLILVEGKTADSLGGHFDLTEPIAADSTLLKPGP